MPGTLTITVVGGPTEVLDLGGLRLLTDPTFDPPGEYEPRPGVRLEKTRGPAVDPNRLGAVDAVLLSHDQHADNLDVTGREYLAGAPAVFTTVSGAGRLGGNALPLGNWRHIDLYRPDGGCLRVTGVPAQHAPDGLEGATGDVTGFVVSGDDVPSVYVSGDNVSLRIVGEIAERFGPPDVAILHAGAAQVADLGDVTVTLPAEAAAEAARILGARTVVPVHVDGWSHYSEGVDDVRRAFAAAGLADRLLVVEPGAAATV